LASLWKAVDIRRDAAFAAALIEVVLGGLRIGSYRAASSGIAGHPSRSRRGW
jgi:hypothetical protein